MADTAPPPKPEKPAPAVHEEPEVVAYTADTSASEPPSITEVEPLLGFDAFANTQTLSLPLQAGLKAWMRVKKHDANGHYSPAAWRGYLRQALDHRG
jgi:hypothetical protein